MNECVNAIDFGKSNSPQLDMDFLFHAFPQGEKERESHLSEISVISSRTLSSSERPRCERDEWHVTAISHLNGALGWRTGTHQSLGSNLGWRFPNLTYVTVGNIVCFVFFAVRGS